MNGSTDKTVNIIYRMIDETKASVDQMNKNFKAAQQASKETGNSVSQTSSIFDSFAGVALGVNQALEIGKKGFELFAGAITTVVDVGKDLINTFIEISRRGGEVQGVTEGFKENFKAASKDIKIFREAVGGSVDDFNLMLMANQAAMSGVTKNVDQMAKIFSVADEKSKRLGISTQEAFDEILNGVQRGRELMLTRLGISTKPLNDEIERIAKLNKAIDQENEKRKKLHQPLREHIADLSEEQKRELLLTSIMQDHTSELDTASEAYDRWNAILANTRDEIATGIAPIFQYLSSQLLPLVQNKIDGIKKAFSDWWNNNKKTIEPMLINLRSSFETLVGSVNKLLSPTEEQRKSFDKLGTSIATNVVKGVNNLVNGFNSFVKWLGDHPEFVKKLGDEFDKLGRFIQTVGSNLQWLLDHADDIAKFFDFLSAGKFSQVTGYIPKPEQAKLGTQNFASSLASKFNPKTKMTFAEGGIVDSLAINGDRNFVRANGGEMILTRTDQNNLLQIIRGNGGQSRHVTVNVTMPGMVVDNPLRVNAIARKVAEYLERNNKTTMLGLNSKF